MKKRIMTIVLAFVMCFTTLALGACETDPGTPPVDIDPDSINVEVDKDIVRELTISIPGGNKNETSMIECLLGPMKGENEDDIITFKTLFPNVDVTINYISVDNYATTVGQDQLAGTLADIVWNNSPDFYDMIDSKTFLNLKPYFTASEKLDAVPTYLDGEGNPSKMNYSEDFVTEFFDMASSGGRCYAAPRSCDTVVTFLNTEMLNAAEVDMSKVKDGWTWDTFMEVCAKVRTWMDTHGHAQDYVIDANLTTWLSVCYPMLVSYGGDVLDEKGNIIIDSEATRNCLNMVKTMVENKYICDSSGDTQGNFDSGNSAMLFQSAAISHYADRVALKGKMDIVSFPLITANNTPKIGAGVAGYSINAASENKELAWAFITFLLSEYGQQRMAKNGLNLVSIRKDLANPATANWGEGYRNLNLAAYSYGPQYKISADFFERAPFSAKAGMERAVKQLFKDASTKEKNGDIGKIIDTAVRDISDAMIEY